jgi:hypothetical protein
MKSGTGTGTTGFRVFAITTRVDSGIFNAVVVRLRPQGASIEQLGRLSASEDECGKEADVRFWRIGRGGQATLKGSSKQADAATRSRSKLKRLRCS